jgi:ribosomal protein S12 methylthiotransferase
MTLTRPTTPNGNPAPKTFAFVTLGCPKNLVDSERMLGKLAQDGYALTPDADGADVVVVNTCGFIEPARQESLGVIREMLALKQQGRVGAVVVAGCLAERKKEDLLQEVPGIDHIVGVFGRDEIAQVVDRTLAQRLEQRALFRPAPVRAQEDTARLRITPRHYAYLKISEGCDRLCTFCAIPGMRGKHVTKPIEEVLREAQELTGDGVRELILVAQDTTYYGTDLYGRVRLADLLRELNQLDGLDWIRILYTYPINFSDELIQVLAECALPPVQHGLKPADQRPTAPPHRKILPYLDLPLQHINDRVLKRMQRRVNRADIEKLLSRLRSAISGLVLRTTFIVGFPGETEAEFEELLDFVRTARFERAGVFTYSFEPGTPATRLDGHLPEEVKQERRHRLMAAQQEVAFDWGRQQVGRELDVIVDGPDPEVPNHVLARSYADAPDIDGLVRVKSKGLRPGDLARVKVTAADGYDLAARALKIR